MCYEHHAGKQIVLQYEYINIMIKSKIRNNYDKHFRIQYTHCCLRKSTAYQPESVSSLSHILRLFNYFNHFRHLLVNLRQLPSPFLSMCACMYFLDNPLPVPRRFFSMCLLTNILCTVLRRVRMPLISYFDLLTVFFVYLYR